MFKLYAEKNKLILQERETVTSGSVNVYRVRFEFSDDWEGLDRTAVFRCDGKSAAMLLDASGECVLPWEVLQTPGFRLEAGVYGTKGGKTVLPTAWASLGTVLLGTTPGENAQPPTQEVWQQELDKKGDSLSYDGLNLMLLSGDKPLSMVPVAGGGEGGVSDHRLLTGRDAENQHPIQSITGLGAELDRIPEPVEPLTNEDLEAILV